MASEVVEISESKTYLELTSRICYYDDTNENGVLLPSENAEDKAQTLVNMPVQAKYRTNIAGLPTFSGHEMYKDENGNVTCVHCTYDPESRGGNSPDGRKVKGTLHWVSEADSFKAEVRLYDRLFNKENPSDESAGAFTENLNPESLIVLNDCLIEGGLKDGLKAGDTFQFMRQGYFCVDITSTEDKVVFNRTVQLNSSWGK